MQFQSLEMVHLRKALHSDMLSPNEYEFYRPKNKFKTVESLHIFYLLKGYMSLCFRKIGVLHIY